MSRLPPLTALRAFEAAARLGSFTLAAQELCVTPGAVSRQIKVLEDHFGRALFDRGHRLVRLTEAGRRYAGLIAGPFAELARAGQVLRADQAQPVVRVDCVPTLAMHWLLPRLGRFHADHPGVSVDLQTSVGPVVPGGDVHFSIRRDPAHFSGLSGVALMTEWCLPVCSPVYAQDHGLTDHGLTDHGLTDHGLADRGALSRATILHIRAREDLWPSWCTAHGVAETALGPRLIVDHTYVAMQAAEDGLGIAVLPWLFVARPIQSGRLVVPWPHPMAMSGTYFLLRHGNRLPAQAEAFARWLADEAALADQDTNRPSGPTRVA